ncbi:MAG: ubiquinone biosynthesis regulatory protein kinase UbiB [Pseudomonadota bacterium]|nr:ubiquinone biosynthesis regulatory protein kinase UbiB [Pseudomonadota bacterium]
MLILRFLKILYVMFANGLDEFLPAGKRLGWLRALFRVSLFWRPLARPRAQRLRFAFERLGPIFVKFGQLLSVRPDLIPADIIAELSKLQDRVPPFSKDEVIDSLHAAYGEPHTNIFCDFDLIPVASASIAQVHFASIRGGHDDGRKAAVKIVRPNINRAIRQDVSLLYLLAVLVEKLLPDGPRLRPREVVREFEKTILDELDMIREASNGSQLKRNFADGRLLYVPEIFWDYCRSKVLVMERIDAIPVNDIEQLKQYNVDIKRLSRDGVEIFFTQVFRDAFFHADMHPGNIFVLRDGRYSGVDFGIMGSLSARDKQYLAQNFMAFFDRDYGRVARAHVEAGWVPKGTRVDEFEGAIRSVCEPIFGRPIKDISFGNLLMRLFDVSRRFKMEIQPQLVLLQKTLLQIEGLGRQLDPDLDIVPIAKPVLKRWMREQIGWRGLVKNIRQEAPLWATILPQLPRLARSYLDRQSPDALEIALTKLEREHTKLKRWLYFLMGLLGVMAALQLGSWFFTVTL